MDASRRSASRSPSSTPTSRQAPLPDSISAPKILSPLNPYSTPTKSNVPLPPSDDDDSAAAALGEKRVRTISSVSAASEEVKGKLSISTYAARGDSSALSLPGKFEVEALPSTFRERSRSPARGSGDLAPEASMSKLASSWWGGEKHVARSWQDSPKRKQTVPKEQTDALHSTRQKVAQAVVSALGTGADIIHEALYVGVELLEFAPVPGLQTAAKTLLAIWDAAQEVDMNRLSCLRLTERCADILISIRHEIHEAGDVVEHELAAPIMKLEESYLTTHRFMLKQTHRPWLKRYLKRDEILRDIAGCDSSLRDALSLFNTSVQIRILRQVQESERRRQSETRALAALIQGRLPLSDLETKMITSSESGTTSEPSPYSDYADNSLETASEFASRDNALGLITDDSGSVTPTSALHSAAIIPAIQSIHDVQNSLDAALDLSDLRQLMRVALQTSTDAEMVEVLQIKRQEMPDAIKALQRALERLAEREGDGAEHIGGKGVVLGKIIRRVSVKEVEGEQSLKRSTTIVSVESSSSSGDSVSGASSEARRRDTLDWEFIESGIDALRRMSRGVETAVPNWTITKYEVDRDEKIGIGFFSDVYKGTWRGRTVAIKVLAESTPRKLFVREIGIWKTLRHPNVLPLYGASSTTGDPPWFFVSPYLKNGTLAEHLKRIEIEVRPAGLGLGPGTVQPTSSYRSPGGRAVSLPALSKGSRNGSPGPEGSSLVPPASSISRSSSSTSSNHIQREWDLFRFMHEIAKGMEYLHGKGILHGDLKAANVLVDDKFRCVISDFGQSEMKSEAYRISGTSPPHGTLRWQSPEIMAGGSQLTTAVDIWAFSICCVEILNMGKMPWSLMDDDSVRHFVLKDNTRPSIPKNSRYNTPAMQDILRACWATKPEQRPPFSKISRDLKLIRKSFGQDVFESPRLPPIEDIPEHTSSPSPDMRPMSNLPQFLQGVTGPIPSDVLHVGSLESNATYQTARDSTPSPAPQQPEQSHRESTVITDEFQMPEPAIYTPGPSNPPSNTSSIILQAHADDEHLKVVEWDGYESPPPIDERSAQIKNERRYRLLLVHDYHPSLTLPLWEPTPVELGSVGYLAKPEGKFVTLFNAYSPVKSPHSVVQRLPSIEGYGRPALGSQRQDRRTFAQKAQDLFGGSLTFGNTSKQVLRRYSFPLKAGHKVAYLCSEITTYEYIETLDAPKKWFQLHADTVLQAYGREHQIQKDDLFLVIGALRTPNYGLFVSHSHPEGHVHFSVYASQKSGQHWGTFTTDQDIARALGPDYGESDEFEIPRLSASKVSIHGDSSSAVLLARLRFKPDAVEPTSK